MCVGLGFAYVATDGVVLLLKDEGRRRVACCGRRHCGEQGRWRGTRVKGNGSRSQLASVKGWLASASGGWGGGNWSVQVDQSGDDQ